MTSGPAALPCQDGRTSPWEEAVLAPWGPMLEIRQPWCLTVPQSCAPQPNGLHKGEGVGHGTQ